MIESNGDYNDFFKKMKESNDFSALGKMHGQNYRNAKSDMLRGVSPVIIDNTGIKPRDSKMYVETALKMGFDEGNIKIVDIGTNGFTAEELANRNTHNVPLETIKRMISSHASIGELTVKKIMESKNGKPKKWASLKLGDNSRKKLIEATKHYIPEGWEVIAKHMTINFGKGLSEDLKSDLGDIKPIRVTKVGVSDMAVAVMVEGYHSDNEIPHITLAINSKEGAKPVMSNDITNWSNLENYINLSGIVNEITFK